MADTRRDAVPPPGPPTDLGWMLSCAGVHPDAVKIVEAYQAEVERLRHEAESLRHELEIARRSAA